MAPSELVPLAPPTRSQATLPQSPSATSTG
jgi:hypothetical protein